MLTLALLKLIQVTETATVQDPSVASTTTTTTTSVQATTTVLQGGPPTTFQIYASGGGASGQYAVVSPYGESSTSEFNGGSSSGTIFSLDGSGDLIQQSGPGTQVGFIANEDAGATFENVYFNSPLAVQESGYAKLSCSINANDDATCSLDCTVNGNSVNSLCSGVWYIGSTTQSCTPFQPNVVG